MTGRAVSSFFKFYGPQIEVKSLIDYLKAARTVKKLLLFAI